MQGVVFFRTIGALALAGSLAACSGGAQNTAATPVPSPASSASPSAVTRTFVATTGAANKNIVFSIYIGGAPAAAMNVGKSKTDITKYLKPGVNHVAIQWKKVTNGGSGTLTLASNGKDLWVQRVAAKDPVKGQHTLNVTGK